MIEICHMVTAINIGIIIVTVGRALGIWLADRR